MEAASAEERARLEELERKDAEEAKRKEEEKARKKQKEKEKIEQLKKEGKFMTKAQKEEKARNERKLQQMLDAGIKVGPAGEAEDKKKPTYEKKRGGTKLDKMVRCFGHSDTDSRCTCNIEADILSSTGRGREGSRRSR